MEKLRVEAADPIALYRRGEAAQTSWKSRVISVLANALGPDSELAERMRSNRYGLMMFTDSTPDSAWERAFASGVETALGYVDAAMFELTLLDGARKRRAAQPSRSARSTAAAADLDLAEPDKRAIFVVHGRNQTARDAMFDFLRALGLLPIEWSQAVLATGRPTPYVGEVLRAAFGRAQAVMVLMTPDDEARLRSELHGPAEPPHEINLTPQARANVLFEAGMAMAWDEDRTVLVELGRCRPFSDLGGRHVVRLDNTSQRRHELMQRLLSAGLAVDATGTDWHTAGSFDAAVSLASSEG
ncbi:MAG: TIR domain-containing protein [Solirubrobacterales bacterium]